MAHALNEDGEFRGQRRNRWRTCSLSEEQLTLLLHNIKVLLQFIQLRYLLLQCSIWKTMIRTITELLNMSNDFRDPDACLVFCDALQTLLQVVSLQRCAELPDQVFLMGLQMHPEVAKF